MKVAVILYHKNINKIYKEEWIEQCIQSIIEQTYKDYYVYDLNYGGDDFNFSKHFSERKSFWNSKIKYKFFSENLENHAEAMNYLFDRCIEDDMDCVFNINLDDYYDLNRFDIQLIKIKEGYDIVSSNFKYIGDFKFDGWGGQSEFNYHHCNNDITKNLEGGNIIGHPSVCYSRNFINKNKYIPTEIPKEDWELWRRTSTDFKFYICEELLLFYRIHGEQITSKAKKIETINMMLENDKDMLTNIGLSEDIVQKIITEELTSEETIETMDKILEYIPPIETCSCGGEISITLKTRVQDSVTIKQKIKFCIKCNKTFQ